MAPSIFSNAATPMEPSIREKNCRLVSPQSGDGSGFWVGCFGSIHDSLPNICGESDNKLSANSSFAIVEEDVDFNAPSKLGGLKASLKRVGSFRRSCSHDDLSVCSAGSVDSQYSHYSQRRRRRRQNNRDTRDPSPSIDNNYKRSLDTSDGKREADTPLLIDPPSTRKRSRSVPLEKLLNSRKEKGAKSTNPSPSLGGGLGAGTSINTKMLNLLEKINVEPFALKHDEVVTALIDDALQDSSDDSSSSASIDRKRTTLYGSPLRKKGSPNRKKITTPQWMRNRPRKSADERSVCSRASGMSRFTNVNTSDFFHPQCVLHKEKGALKDSSQGNAPSAVGREAALAKLMEKLVLLSEIESGKYGKGADMLRSDAVAFPIQGYMGLDAVETRSILTIRMGFVSMNYGIVLQWDLASELAKQVVLVKMCRDDFLERNQFEFTNSGNHTVVTDSDGDEENSILISDASRTDYSPGRALKTDVNSSSVGQAHLAVSILNVKQLVPKCDRHRADHFRWPWSRATDPEPKSKSRKSDHSDVRPYVRFVFGQNQHLTKSVKYNKGNITWNKRQRNSCLLPCPPEDQRWFSGQDDLIVEVRSKQRSSDDSSTGGRFIPKSFFKEETSSPKRKATDDPLLAAVTVPLSSIIFDEEEAMDSLDGKTRSALSRVTRLFKKNPSKTKDETPSNNITLPLPMKCCSSAPFGSISLRITMKTPAVYRDTPPLPVPSVKIPCPLQISRRALQTKVEASHQQVEGIELLPLTSLISSWVNDGAQANSKNKNKATMSKVMMWTKRYDPRTKKWSNVNASIKNTLDASIKRRPSFKKATKKKHEDSDDDRSIISNISHVVDRVMGKGAEEEKKQFSLKPATHALQHAGHELNRSLHKVSDQVKERKKVVGSRINETVQHVQERKKIVESRLNEKVHHVKERSEKAHENMYHVRKRASAANRIANGRRPR